jgi:DNA-binding beta-propeller fold protein YncE
MRGSLVWFCVLVGSVSLWGTPAVAKVIHVQDSEYGSEGSGPGQFSGPLGLAVNDQTHNVYVVDGGNGRVEEFSSPSAGSTFIGQFDASAAPTGSLIEPSEVAVDNSSNPLDPSKEDVYVVDRGHGVIDKFDANGTYVGQITGVDTPEGAFASGTGDIRSIKGLAVDSNGAVWVSLKQGPIYQFDTALENKYVSLRETAFGGAAEGLGIDPEENIYLNTGGGEYAKVNHLGETLISPFGGDMQALRVAVDPAGQEVYLDNGDRTEAFSLAGQPIEEFGFGSLTFSKGLAVDSSDGTVYVSDQPTDRIVVFVALTQPDVAIESVTEQQPRSLTLNGSVNPEGAPVSACTFEYGTTSAYGQSAPCSPADLGTGSSPVPVNASLTGLEPESVYHYRLVAENAAGKSVTPDQILLTGPILGREFAKDVASDSATLQIDIDPNGADTQYYLEYGLTAAYGRYAPVPPPGVDLGSDVGKRTIEVHLQALEEGTVYHYSFVAIQNGELFKEPDRVFTSESLGASNAASDGRAWELVSPSNKKGALVELFEAGGQVQAADNGDGITYMSNGPALGQNPVGHVTLSQVLSRRGAAGWVSQDLTLPGRLPENGEPAEAIGTYQIEYHLFSPDLSLAAVEPQSGGTPPLSPGVTERTLYWRDDFTGVFSPLVTSANVSELPIEEPNFAGAEPNEFEMHFLAATPDLSHVVFKTPMALTSDAFHEETVQKSVLGRVQWNVYEWDKGHLLLVNVLPGNEGVAHGPYPAVPPVRLAGMTSSAGLGRGGVQRAISNDGRRVAWTWGEPYTTDELKSYRGLYVRDMVEEKTVRIGGPSAAFQTMNSDGSKIFFIENEDLYEFDFDTQTQTDLTEAHGMGPNAGVQEAVSNVSEDGSYVYFVARGVLASGGVGGEDNLYVLHSAGTGWDTAYIATLSPEDKPTWYAKGNFGAPLLSGVSSRVSPDGRYFTFMSDRELTGYDNIDASSGEPDEEVYLYDAQMKKLVCASCNPTGARPVGVFDTPEDELLVDRQGVWTQRGNSEEDKHTNHWLAASIPGWDNLNENPPTYQPRYLSDSGRLFFDSADALVPQDTNGLEDVYEFEPAGVGGCGSSERTNENTGGCVDLISSGTSSSESAFFDASGNGDDVFFGTIAKLTGEDYDKGHDVYDAHVCSEIAPCKSATTSPPSCSSGDSCKAAPSPQPPIFGPAPSATFNGVGNVPIRSRTNVKPKSRTASEKLKRALRACAKKRKGKQRNICRRKARRRYSGKRDRGSTVASGKRG